MCFIKMDVFTYIIQNLVTFGKLKSYHVMKNSIQQTYIYTGKWLKGILEDRVAYKIGEEKWNIQEEK